MTPSKHWPKGCLFQVDVNPDVFRIVDGGVQVYSACSEKWGEVLLFGSKEFKSVFSGRETYGINQRKIDAFLDGNPIYA